MYDLRDVRRDMTAFLKTHMQPTADGRYYATPELAVKLQTMLRAKGLDECSVTCMPDHTFVVVATPAQCIDPEDFDEEPKPRAKSVALPASHCPWCGVKVAP